MLKKKQNSFVRITFGDKFTLSMDHLFKEDNYIEIANIVSQIPAPLSVNVSYCTALASSAVSKTYRDNSKSNQRCPVSIGTSTNQ